MKRQDVSGEETLHTDGSGGAGSNVNVTGINGTAPSTGLGASDAGTLRVAISSDSPSAGNPAASATGAAVPADADYQGLNVGGTLRGATGVNPSGSIFAEQVDLASIAGTTAATSNGGVTAGTLRVALASDSTGVVRTQDGSGNNLASRLLNDQVQGTDRGLIINSVIHGLTTAGGGAYVDVKVNPSGALSVDPGTVTVTGTVTANQGTNPWVVGQGTASALNATVVQGTGSNLHTVLDSGTLTSITNAVTVSQGTAANLNATVVGTGTFAVQASCTQSTSPWIVAGGGTAGTAASGVVTVQGIASMTPVQVSQATASNLNATAVLAAGTALIGQVSASNETATVYSGTTALTPKFATIVASASGATTIVALVGGKRIRVLRMSLMANGTVNVKWQSHVTPTDLTGLYYLVANTGWVENYSPVGIFQTVSGEALDINLSANIAVGGSLVYVEV